MGYSNRHRIAVASVLLGAVAVACTPTAPGETTTTTTTTTTIAAPVFVTPMVVNGNAHTCSLSAAGAVRCWGANSSGQLGDGTTTDRPAPTPVTGLSSGVAALAAGDNQTCALTTAGSVRCWGANGKGQLGNDSTTDSSVPVDVVGLSSGVNAIGAGDNQTCAALTAGGIRCWGWNFFGQLGNNSTADSRVPVAVSGITAGATSLSSSYSHTCAALTSGAAACWGTNSNGQLGNGTTTRSLVPVTPTGLTSGVTDVAAGGSHTCAVVTGAARCWGLNSLGQLGNGTTTRSLVPVTPTGLTSGVTDVAAGGVHSCALTGAGAVTCWGTNAEGELGTGELQVGSRTMPATVSGLASSQTSLDSGLQHACARAGTGTIRCWGFNASGQLGDGTTTTAFSPVTVTGT